MRIKRMMGQGIFLVFLFGSVLLALIGIMQIKWNISNHEFTSYFIHQGNRYIDDNLNLTKKITSMMSGFDIDHPITILENNVIFKDDNFDDLIKETSYIIDPRYISSSNPQIYLYSINQLETYTSKGAFIKPNVMMATYNLRDQLNKYDIESLIDNTDFTPYLFNNISLEQLSQIIKNITSEKLLKNKTIKLKMIISRDLASYKNTTIKNDNLKLARILFIASKKNTSSIKLANLLNEKLNELVPDLSRGVLVKDDPVTTNIIFSDATVIIKCGGIENSLDEVNNTIEILSQLINNYLGGVYGEI